MRISTPGTRTRVLDGGRSLRHRSEAFGAAAAAARAGVQELDESVAVAEGIVRIDAAAARSAAHAHLAQRGFSGSVEVAGDEVTVTVSGRTTFRILPGSAGFKVFATARAEEGLPDP